MSNRILSDSLLTSETLDELCPSQENLFYRLLVVVDDYGCTDARPVVVLARCYPLRISKISVEDMKTWLLDLARVGLITLYQAEGKEYLQVSKWEKHQRVRNKRHKYPLPAADDSDTQQITATLDKLLQSAATCRNSPPVSLSLSESLSLSKDKDSVEQKMLDDPPSTISKPKNSRRTSLIDDPVVSLYTKICVPKGLPSVKALTVNRQRAIKRVTADYGLERLEALFKKAVTSEFLLGRTQSTSHQGWKADFDFLLRGDTLVYIDEGSRYFGDVVSATAAKILVTELTPEQDAKHKQEARRWLMDEKAKEEAR